ncbi:uncharacterized protein L3040_009073 [Drepanopeziza brunnea f. sp. 'multigermtubi']|uniref:Ubiquitin-like domain-containing protein n=1 Tax=Marssonina brunnea f. sp. multigermtubi (strain MB_m1) TaxID=1072389 RepID=K1XSW0_MARBU|nr:uncharacterized protein MBM_06227 [Drepanopeziza brunnea f. sp. 'multigermtubi' MB_m1]EKD15599.1 hypothetical protein MBM_06227 [Drepanopeziza brunnea f. sp. 'multigermtubi' MB_m1]KAJ5032469.1 hypothetical protein L3040_009073 [Drepanopeziza brunnea f. sp. 'multigermtubi']
MEDDDFGNMSAEEVAPVKPAKKSLFSKRITVKPAPEGEGEGDEVEFFSRAKVLYPVRAAEQKRKQQKKQVKLERKRSSTSAETTLSPSGEKRRRVSSLNTTYSSDENVVKKGEGATQYQSGSIESKAHGSPTSLSARYSNELRKPRFSKDEAPANRKGYLSLSDSESDSEKGPAETLPVRIPANRPIDLDSEDDFETVSRKTPAPPPLPPVEDKTEESEEEFPELVAAALERERQKVAKKVSESVASQGQPDGHDFGDPFDGYGTNHNTDPVIDVLITSQIENSTALRVKRKLSQQLKIVKTSWCDRQRFDGQPMTPEARDQIFLTWKGNKLFDFNTCKSLIDPKSREFSDDLSEDGAQLVHLEAWTPEIFAIWKQRCEEKLRKERIEAGEEEAPVEAPVKKTKLVMKSKDTEYKLVVKPHTTVQKMIQAFRREKEIPEEKEITLHLDGDQLDLESRVEELDLEDMDNIEVHIH